MRADATTVKMNHASLVEGHAMKISQYIIIAAATLVFVAAPAVADVITLSDGSKLLGTVERMDGGKLILETKFAGTLEIDAALVTSIATDDAVNVGMDTGDRLVGPVEWKPGIDRAVVQTEMGGIPVDVQRIEAIWPTGGKSPEALAMEAQVAEAREQAEAARARWSLTIEAGVIFKEGNTNELTARGRIEARRKSDRDLLRFYLAGDYGETSKHRDTAEVIAGAYYEYLFTERFFGYGSVEMEYDEFENIEFRLSTAVGAGYYWIKKDTHEFKTRAGIGFLHETYLPEEDEDGDEFRHDPKNTAQADLGYDYRIDINPWLQFLHGTTWYPTFESIRDYRLVSDTAFIFPLGDSEVWKLKIGAQYEYKSLPIGDAMRLDQTYYANILLDLK